MRKFIFIFILFVTISFIKQANASSYSLNEQAIDQLFDNAVETNMLSFNVTDLSSVASTFPSSAVAAAGKEKSAVVAIVLDFFLGGLGIHRFYLGTKTMTGLGYILTCGGIFGIVPLVDFIVLIIDNQNISPYIDNPKFFMW
jgi:TM2 domain-containing membrane protein YozV